MEITPGTLLKSIGSPTDLKKLSKEQPIEISQQEISTIIGEGYLNSKFTGDCLRDRDQTYAEAG